MRLPSKATTARASGILATAATALIMAAVPSQASAAGTTCDLVAATNGSDTAPGTAAQPLRTARKLVGSLRAGQTGCLRAGTYSADNEVKFLVGGVTLTSYPGERATVAGRIYVPQGADGVTISDLDLDGRNTGSLPSPTINANNVVIRGNDITNYGTEICISVGSPTWGRARNTLIEGNKIHDCGKLPSTNMDHGIYVNSADDTIIRGNWIYDNADRGVQLYSDAQGTLISGNVIDGNGEGVIFGGDSDSASSNNVVQNNVITNSRIRHNVESNWTNQVGTGNVVRNNCIGGGVYGSDAGGILGGTLAKLGFSAVDNLDSVPRFADRSAGDFSIADSDPCAAILAGGNAPAAAAPTAPSATGGAVTISTSKKHVRRMRPVRVSGKARGAGSVTLLVRDGKRWRRVGRSDTTNAGGYRLKVRLRGSGTSRLKAEAQGLRPSRSIRLRIK